MADFVVKVADWEVRVTAPVLSIAGPAPWMRRKLVGPGGVFTRQTLQPLAVGGRRVSRAASGFER